MHDSLRPGDFGRHRLVPLDCIIKLNLITGRIPNPAEHTDAGHQESAHLPWRWRAWQPQAPGCPWSQAGPGVPAPAACPAQSPPLQQRPHERPQSGWAQTRAAGSWAPGCCQIPGAPQGALGRRPAASLGVGVQGLGFGAGIQGAGSGLSVRGCSMVCWVCLCVAAARCARSASVWLHLSWSSLGLCTWQPGTQGGWSALALLRCVGPGWDILYLWLSRRSQQTMCR